MTVVLWLAASALFAVAVLAIPVDLRLGIERNGRTHVRGRVEWLFGWVGRDVARESAQESARERRESGPGSSTSLRRWAPLGAPDFRARLVVLGRRLLHSLRIRELAVRGRFGLGDPADTGMAYGLLSPLIAAARSQPRVEVDLEPDFERAGIAGALLGDVRAWPLGLLASAIAFALSPATLRALWRLRGARA